jgi:hypothetical protein
MPDGMLDPSKSINIPYLIPQTAEDETTAFGWFKTETVVVDTLFFWFVEREILPQERDL